MRGSLEQMMSQLKTSGRKEFPLVVKADVQGSLEAILGSLEKLGTDEVAARILHAGVGGISESDVTLAEGFNAAIIGFSVRANKEAAASSKRNGIEIRYYNIIYDLVDDVKKAMSGLLAPTVREMFLGNAEVLHHIRCGAPRDGDNMVCGTHKLEPRLVSAAGPWVNEIQLRE